MRLMKTARETTPAERTKRSVWPPEAASASAASSLPAVLFKEVGNGRDPRVVIRDLEFFVGRMQPIVRQAEAHQNGWNPQMRGEVPHDWNGAAAADEHGFAAQDIGKRARGYFDRVVIRIHRNGGTRAEH